MARRMTLEGAHVKLVAEIMPYSSGLKRNIVQCLDDYDIPLKLSHTVTKIHGKERLEGVTISKVDENLKPIPGSEDYVACDTLLLSVGLIPENELTEMISDKISPVTKGPVVDETFSTDVEGVFACGNVLHVHDLVDYVYPKKLRRLAKMRLTTSWIDLTILITTISVCNLWDQFPIPYHLSFIRRQKKIPWFASESEKSFVMATSR